MEYSPLYKIYLALVCPSCCEILKDPIVLHCSHIFCSNCVKLMIQMFREMNSEFCCPECHATEPVFPLSKNWLISDKIINGILTGLPRVVNENEIPCALCKCKGEFCCTVCKIFLCAQCKEKHCLSKYRFHTVVDYKTYKKVYCFQHLLPKIFFSLTDQILVCQACGLSKTDIQKLSDTLLDSLGSVLSSIKSQYSTLDYYKLLYSQGNPFKLIQYFSPLEQNLNFSPSAPDPNPDICLIERSSNFYYVFKGLKKKLSTQSRIPISRWCAMTILPGNNILLTGGKSDKDKGANNTFVIINYISFLCISGSMLTSHSSHPAVLAQNSLVYILGGKDAENLTSTQCEALDPETLLSKKISSMHYGRTCAVAVHFNNFLFVFGGFVNGFTNLIEKYSINEDLWVVLSSTLPVRLFQAGAVVVDNASVLIFGGEISSDLKNLNSFVFDLKTEKFSLCRKMKVKEHFLGFWYHGVWTGKFVNCLKKGSMLTFDLESTIWSKDIVKI